MEQYLKEKARLSGEAYIEPSADPGGLGTIRVSVWVDKTSHEYCSCSTPSPRLLSQANQAEQTSSP